LYTAYLDESGTTTPFRDTDRFLVVIGMIVDQKASRALGLHLKRLRQKTRTTPGGELKATYATPKQRLRLLQVVSNEDVGIVAVVVDKRKVRQAPDDPEDWYRVATSLVVWHCIRRWPHLTVVVDKRYTKKCLRDALETAILAKLGEVVNTPAIAHKESNTSPELQVADYVAWAVKRKYEAGDLESYDLIKARMIVEEVVLAK
jgi:hypothetical protein